MRLWPKRKPRPGVQRTAEPADLRYLKEWIASRHGVEGFIEPKTAVTETTLLLVAVDGEWTRRRVPSPEWAREFAGDNRIPVYDAALVGYPQRMRDWNRRGQTAGPATAD